MVRETQYINIRRILDDLTDHPLLTDLSLEQAVRHTLRFIAQHGYPGLYEDKIGTVEIKDFRGTLPCDLVSIVQVRDMGTGIYLRKMTDTFTPGLHEPPKDRREEERYNQVTGDVHDCREPFRKPFEELTYKTQNRVIFTSFPEGCVEIAYKSTPVDEDGFPMLLDDEVYLGALEAYIKKQVFTVKFDTGKIKGDVLKNAQQEYAWLAGKLGTAMAMPSYSEMQAITNYWTSAIKTVSSFYNGFRDMGNKEFLRKHR